MNLESLTESRSNNSSATMNPGDLVARTYSNGISKFQVVGIDAANPTTHVVAEHLTMKHRFAISASIVSRYVQIEATRE